MTRSTHTASDEPRLEAVLEELRESEARFRFLFEDNPAMYFTVDERGTVLAVNRYGAAYLGFTVAELEGQSVLELVHEDDRARVRDHLAECTRSPGQLCRWEFRKVRKDGSTLWVREAARPVRTADGDLVLLIACDDITEQRRYADERERLFAREQAARTEAERAVRARDDVLSVVSHDLRNPLSTIFMSSAFLLDILPTGAERGTERKQLEIIRRAAGNMNRMIQDLLDIARIEAGGLAVRLVPTEVQPVLEDAAAMLRPLADGGGIVLQCAAPVALPPICADRERLLQIFSNLVGNAVKFTPKGGSITMAAEPDAGGVLFRVSDTGSGIPPEQIPRLFDRMWQANRTDRRGLGLGLAIVKGLVEAHGGEVRVESVVGAGSTFSFRIPVA